MYSLCLSVPTNAFPVSMFASSPSDSIDNDVFSNVDPGGKGDSAVDGGGFGCEPGLPASAVGGGAGLSSMSLFCFAGDSGAEATFNSAN